MKLRLPNKLITALLSAAAPALFSTLSSASLGAAALVAFSSQAEAAAEWSADNKTGGHAYYYLDKSGAETEIETLVLPTADAHDFVKQQSSVTDSYVTVGIVAGVANQQVHIGKVEAADGQTFMVAQRPWDGTPNINVLIDTLEFAAAAGSDATYGGGGFTVNASQSATLKNVNGTLKSLTNSGNLTLDGTFTVTESLTLNSGSSLTLAENSHLKYSHSADAAAVESILNHTSGDGKLTITLSSGAETEMYNKNFAFNAKDTVFEGFMLRINSNATGAKTYTIDNTQSLTFKGTYLRLESETTLDISGALTVSDRANLQLGHTAAGGNYGRLNILDGANVVLTGIKVWNNGSDDNNNQLNMSGGTLQITGSQMFDNTSTMSTTAVNFTGGTLLADGNDWTLNQYANIGNVTMKATSDRTLTVSALLSDAADNTGKITKTGAGILKLSNTQNTFTGGTHVAEGTLTAVGATLGTGDIAIDAGAKLLVQGSADVTLAQDITISGSGTAELGTDANVILNGSLTTADSTVFKKSGNATLTLNGTSNTVGNLEVSAGKIHLGENTSLTLTTSLNAGSKDLSKLTGAATAVLNLKEQHGIASGAGSYATISLDNDFTGTLHYQGGMTYSSNLGGASKVVFGGTSNICFNDSTQGQNHTFAKNIELDNGATLGLSTWGSSSLTADNRLTGSIKGGADTTISKRDQGAITLAGDLSEFHGTFDMQSGHYGFAIEVAEGQTNTTDASFSGGIQLRKTGEGTLTLNGSTLAAGLHIKNEGAAGSFVLSEVTLGEGDGRLNIEGGTVTFRNGITDNTTEGNKYAVVVENSAVADFTAGTYEMGTKNLAANTSATIKVSNNGRLEAGALFYTPDGSRGAIIVENTGTLIVGDAETQITDKHGKKGAVRVASFTNRGTTELHGYANITNLTNEGGSLSLLGTQEKLFTNFTQSGETATLVVAGDLNVETSIATNGTMEGTIDLQDNASLVLKNLNNAAKFELNNLSIGSGTLSAYTGTQLDAQHEADLTVTGTLTASNSSTLNANLTVGSNATLNLGTEGLTMGSAIKLSTGSHITLTGDILNALAGLSWQEGSVTLFSGVDAFYVDGEQQSYGYSQSANNFFNIATLPHGYDLTLQYKASDNGDGGTLSLWMETPEPATATLSLLALAALAARRKRK